MTRILFGGYICTFLGENGSRVPLEATMSPDPHISIERLACYEEGEFPDLRVHEIRMCMHLDGPTVKEVCDG